EVIGRWRFGERDSGGEEEPPEGNGCDRDARDAHSACGPRGRTKRHGRKPSRATLESTCASEHGSRSVAPREAAAMESVRSGSESGRAFDRCARRGSQRLGTGRERLEPAEAGLGVDGRKQMLPMPARIAIRKGTGSRAGVLEEHQEQIDRGSVTVRAGMVM